jgi:Tfp pilus assembly protein PilX
MTANRSAIRNQQGVALVLSLFLLLAVSVVGASLMYLSQSETYSSMNYRLMSQARYGAEAGVQRASNFLMYTTSYTAPATGSGTDPISAYNTGVSPVTYNNSPVILSANSSVTANYPVAAVKTAFAAIAGTLSTGTSTVTYAPYATLMSMEEIPAASAVDGVAHTLQTWQITADGTMPVGGRTAQVQVTATLDTQKISTQGNSLAYGVFATADTCGAITFSGGGETKSYDSSTYTQNGSAPTAANGGLLNSGGNVGTNGNLTDSGNAIIYGTLTTPRVGVGKCSSGNVTAEATSGGATVTGGIVQLSQPVPFSTPSIADPGPPTTNLNITGSSTCLTFLTVLPAGAICTGATGATGLTINPNGQTITWGDLSLSGGASLTLKGGTYNVNSFSESGGSTITTSLGTVTMTVSKNFSMAGNSNLVLNATTKLNVVNTSSSNTPVDFSGGTVSNPSYQPTRFQITYGGNKDMKLTGGSAFASVVYAPNSAIDLSGGSGFYGEMVGKTIKNTGGTTIYYDRNLANSGLFTTTQFMPGNPMMSAFSWKTF